MAQICPAKSTIVPFKKQMYSSGSIILSYKDDKCICVSIHAPTRGATIWQEQKEFNRIVSIHAPTRGATKQLWAYMHGRKFQSTHPRGVRHDLVKDDEPAQQVSIHAPTRGATKCGMAIAARTFSFNPRTHEGCDTVDLTRAEEENLFQSTHPRGVRLDNSLGSVATFYVSIHAPTRGATGRRDCEPYSPTVSIHAPTRGATECVQHSVYKKAVSIHAPTRGATQ